MAEERLGVLITRPEPEATRLAARLSAGGYAPILSPMLEIHRVERLTADAVVGMRAALLTSARAAQAAGEDLGPASLSTMTAYCVGAATAAAARKAGFGAAETAPAAASGKIGAAALVDWVRAAREPVEGPLLFLRGETVKTDVAQALSAAGFSVAAKVLYAAQPAEGLRSAARDAFVDKRVAAALLLSERTAHRLAEVLDDAGEGVEAGIATAVCISEPVAKAARAARFRRIVAAPRPDLDATLKTLDGIFGGTAGQTERVC